MRSRRRSLTTQLELTLRAVRITILCPAPKGSRLGNRITALRWQRMLSALGHEVRVVTELDRRRWDVLFALHARRSAAAVRAARRDFPERRVVVVLTGTDLYRDLPADAEARHSLALADALVVLQARAALRVPRRHRAKTYVVQQSASPVRAPRRRARTTFDVAVVGHLRAEKDPLRAALAARLLPPSSRVRVLHAGRALTPEDAEAARQESSENPRYVWVGELAPARARALLAGADLLALTSVMEGGANVLSEAIVSGTAIVATRIDAAVSLLSSDYPGLYRPRATRALARLFARAESEPAFLRDLRARCRRARPLVTEAAERRALRDVLRALAALPV